MRTTTLEHSHLGTDTLLPVHSSKSPSVLQQQTHCMDGVRVVNASRGGSCLCSTERVATVVHKRTSERPANAYGTPSWTYGCGGRPVASCVSRCSPKQRVAACCQSSSVISLRSSSCQRYSWVPVGCVMGTRSRAQHCGTLCNMTAVSVYTGNT